jgi:hypothetical protein
MACSIGQRFQDELDKAATIRAQYETGSHDGTVLMEAKIKESSALQRRSVHVRDCSECWVRPPRHRDDAVTFAGLMAAS